jgi:predicted transcriptional regulator
MDAIIQNMHLLSDTELRIVLVIVSTNEIMSVLDLQEKTNRGRMVYTALQNLKEQGIISQSHVQIVDSVRKYKWSCVWVKQQTAAKESARASSDAKPKKISKPVVNPNQSHPAVIVYVDVTHRRPKQFIADVIAQNVAFEGEDLNQWKSIVELWILSGWNPNNVDGMLDMYKKRHQPKEQRGKRRVVLTNEPPVKNEAQTSAMLEEYLKENGVFNEEN